MRHGARIMAAAVTFCFFGSVPGWNQTWKPEALPPQKIAAIVDMIRSDVGERQKSIVEKVMDFSEADARVFWPIYTEYQMEYGELGNENVALIKDYVESIDKMTEETASKLMTRAMDIQKRKLEVRQKYYNRVRKALSAIKAAKFLQIDSQLAVMLDLQISSNLPFIR